MMITERIVTITCWVLMSFGLLHAIYMAAADLSEKSRRINGFANAGIYILWSALNFFDEVFYKNFERPALAILFFALFLINLILLKFQIKLYRESL